MHERWAGCEASSGHHAHKPARWTLLLAERQLLGEERQDLLLEALWDPAVVVALVRLEGVGHVEPVEAVDEDLVAGEQAVLEPDVERDRLVFLEVPGVLVEHGDRRV